MFTTSDKVALGICGVVVLTGLVVVQKAWKGIIEIRERNVLLMKITKRLGEKILKSEEAE